MRGCGGERSRAGGERHVRPFPPSPGAASQACPAFSRSAAELEEHVWALGPDRATELLGVRPADLAALLEGRVAPPSEGMRRLREVGE
jgi:hypothetical protein